MTKVIVISELKEGTSRVSSWPEHPRQYPGHRGPRPPVSVGPRRARLFPSAKFSFISGTAGWPSVFLLSYFVRSLPPGLPSCLLVGHLVEDVLEHSVCLLLALLFVRLEHEGLLDLEIM